MRRKDTCLTAFLGGSGTHWRSYITEFAQGERLAIRSDRHNNAPILGNVHLYRCVCNFWMWGATALGFLLYPTAECAVKQLLHKYDQPPPPPGRTQRQHVAFQVLSRLGTFLQQVEFEPGLRPRNMNPIAFITHATWSYWELVQRNPPEVIAIIPNEECAQAYEELIKREVRTSVFFLARSLSNQTSPRSHNLHGRPR